MKPAYSPSLYYKLTFIILLCMCLAQFDAFAQTPGLIYKPATNGGNKVLDPNSDGYVAKSKAGFNGTNDESDVNSEIPYRPLPAMEREPLNDLVTGSNGGHTDFAPPTSGGTGSPFAAYFDGTNIIFRVRLGGQSTASKGYSVMIDSDGKYGNLVSGTTPSKTPNPGFEFEVVLASNFDVAIYDHRDKPDGSSTKFWSGSVDQYSQKSIAASTNSSNPDYFYDFYVPLTGFGGGITASTKLRMSGITITSAQSGITGTVSDVGGVNFAGAYNGDARNAWRDVINTFPAVSLTELKNGGFSTTVLAKPPVVSGPIKNNDTSISGTATAASGSTIHLYKTSSTGTLVLIGQTTVLTGGTWTLSNIPIGTLAAGDKITATVGTSIHSLQVTVISTNNFCITTTAPTITGTSNGNVKSLTGTTPYAGSQVIKLYLNGSSTSTISYTVTPTGTAAPYNWDTGIHLNAGMWSVTTTPVGLCESPKSNELCYNGNGKSTFNSQPNLTITSIVFKDNRAATTDENVASNIRFVKFKFASAPSKAIKVFLFVNGIRHSPFITVNSGTTIDTDLDVSNFVFKAGDFLSVRSIEENVNDGSYACGDLASRASNFKTISEASTAPLIFGPFCSSTTVTSMWGTSIEVPGSTIKLYRTGTTAQIGSTTVNSEGKWTITGLTISPNNTDTYFATATATNKVESTASGTVKVLSPSSNTGLAITTDPIQEGATTLRGSGTNGDVISVYVDGSPISTPPATWSGSTWTISGISPLELFAGGSVWVTAKTASSCESAASDTKIVQCIPPRTNFTVTIPAGKICYASPATITLQTTEIGVIYNLNIGSDRTGTSVLGTGNKIVINTANLTPLPETDPTPVSVQVKAMKIGAPGCEVNIGPTQSIGVYPKIPDAYTLDATSLTGCPNTTSVITVTNALGGYTYQIYNVDTQKLEGSPMTRSANGTFSFAPHRVDKTTVYSVLIINSTTGCQTQNINDKKITITRTGPDASLPVTATSSSVCVNSNTTINFTTQGTSYTYTLINKATGAKQPNTESVVGNSGDRGINTGNLAAGTHTFQIQVIGPSCTSLYTQEVTVTATNGAAPVSAGNDATTCGTSYTLSGSSPAPGSGKWTQGSNNPIGATIQNDTNPNTIVSGLKSGIYKFIWTVTINCGNNSQSASNTVTITVNCPAEGRTLSNKFVTEYQNGERLATILDESDGGIPTTFTLQNGALPPGTAFRLYDIPAIAEKPATKGMELYVTNPNNLIAGNYTYTMRSTDAKGVTTDVPLTTRMYSSSEAPQPVAPLPVEIVYFTASLQNGTVNLQWLTASEKDNKHFEVERSADGKTYQNIGLVNGNGDSSLPIKYSFLDRNPQQGTAYYRLKQVDTDGKFTFSKVIVVSAKSLAADMRIQAYPNPFDAELNITVTAAQGSSANLQLVDMRGRTVHSATVQLEAGINESQLPVGNLQKGVYVLKLNGNGLQGAVKVLKQ